VFDLTWRELFVVWYYHG